MKTLSALIKEYKETNDDSLKDTIWDFILSDENNDLFKDIFVYRDDCDWVEYEETTKLKRLCPKHFVATQVLKTIQKETLHAFKERSFGKYFWSRAKQPAAIPLEEFKTKLSESGWRRTYV